MPEELKRTFALKLKLNPEEAKQLNSFMDEWGEATQFTLKHINNIYSSYQEIENPKIAKCPECKTEELSLKWLHKQSRTTICNRCFSMVWSMQTLTKAKGFQKDLIDNFPDLSPAHKGYIAGVIKFSVQAFKSWMKKCKEREKEIKQLEIEIKAAQNIKQQLKLQSKLKFKLKGIKDITFGKNIIYMGNAGMFDFELRGDRYYIGLTDPDKKHSKLWFKLALGSKEEYHTEHNKYKIIEEALADKSHKKLFGKIRRYPNHDGYIYEFMFPKRDLSNSLTTTEEIQNFYKKNQDYPVITLAFGIKTPILMLARIGKVIKEIKTFGDGSFWHRITRERQHRAMMMRIFASRYQSKWRRNKAKKNFFRKRSRFESDFIKTHTQKLTTEVISYIKKKYGKCIIIMRDMKGIKRINYPPEYRTVLHRWNIEMQKMMLEYKQKLNNFHALAVPYKESNNVKCSKCQKEIKEGKKTLKVLTLILEDGIQKREFLKHKSNMLQQKINKLSTYPANSENRLWIQKTSEELTEIKEKLGNAEEKKHGMIKCPCGYQNSFLCNDAINLSHSLRHGIEMP